MGERISDEGIAGNRPRASRLFYNSKHALSTNILLKQQLGDFKMRNAPNIPSKRNSLARSGFGEEVSRY
jgi:hypothetical protein